MHERSTMKYKYSMMAFNLRVTKRWLELKEKMKCMCVDQFCTNLLLDSYVQTIA